MNFKQDFEDNAKVLSSTEVIPTDPWKNSFFFFLYVQSHLFHQLSAELPSTTQQFWGISLEPTETEQIMKKSKTPAANTKRAECSQKWATAWLTLGSHSYTLLRSGCRLSVSKHKH